MKKTVLLALAGLAVTVFMLVSESVMSGGIFEAASRECYRLLYLFQAPVRLLLTVLDARTGHHWSMLSKLIAYGSTPFILLALWFGYRRVRIGPASAPDAPPIDTSRRAFMVDGAAVAGAAVFAVGLYDATWRETGAAVVREYRAEIRGLPSSLEGLRILHLSDTHYGPFISLAYLRRVIAKANALQPDLVLLTGDYVHQTPRAIANGVGVLGELRARLGIAGVLGNHDHWEGAAPSRDAFKKTGIPLIDNRRLFLTAKGFKPEKDGGEGIVIAGVGDMWCDQVLYGRALGGLDAATPRLFLSHNPDVAEEIPPGLRVDLQLSGHTHGGQVRLPGFAVKWAPTRYGMKYLGGWCEGPRGPVLVSRGVGMAGAPIRFRVPSEMGLVTLVRGAQRN